jgi:MFS family permease
MLTIHSDQGVMSGIISAPEFNNAFPQTRGDSTWQGFVTAIYEIGCLAGAIFQLLFGDNLGRRRAIIIGGVIMILGVIIQVTAMPGNGAMAQFVIGRTITGIGNGMNTSTIPTYQAECSRTTNRGLLICIEGSVIAFGTLIAYWIDFGASYGKLEPFPSTMRILLLTSRFLQAHLISHGASQLPFKSCLAHFYLVLCSSYQSHLVGL